MHFSNFLLPILLSLTLSSALFPTKLIYEFPKNESTIWVENLAVRPNGEILITTWTAPAGNPTLYLIDPLSINPQPSLVHHFSDALIVLGITETTPDTYYVVVSNGTLANLTLSGAPNRIFRVSFPSNNGSPAVTQIANLPDAKSLNGLTTLNSNTILAADSVKGVIWAINTLTGNSRIAINDPLFFNNNLPIGLGVNGIKIYNNTLYFTNTAQQLYGKIPIHADGTAAGKAVVIAPSPNGTFFDDFVLDRQGKAFLAVRSANEVTEIKYDGGSQLVVANGSDIQSPSALEFGRSERDRRVLYVTGGDVFGLSAIDVGYE